MCHIECHSMPLHAMPCHATHDTSVYLYWCCAYCKRCGTNAFAITSVPDSRSQTQCTHQNPSLACCRNIYTLCSSWAPIHHCCGVQMQLSLDVCPCNLVVHKHWLLQVPRALLCRDGDGTHGRISADPLGHATCELPRQSLASCLYQLSR